MDNQKTDTQSWKSTRILVVEDDSVNQLVIASMLKKFGCKVDLAPDGESALQAFRSTQYAMVFMDIGLPGMDGWKTFDHMHETKWHQNQKTVFIATTAHAFAEDRTLSLRAGMHDFVTKPISLNIIQEMLQKWIPSQTTTNQPNVQNTWDHNKQQKTQQPRARRSKAPTTNSGIFDKDQMMECVDSDITLARRMIKTFIKTIPDQLTNLKAAIERGEYGLAEDLAHRIKGASAYIGGEAMRRTAYRLEKSAQMQNRQNLLALALELEYDFTNLKQEWERNIV